MSSSKRRVQIRIKCGKQRKLCEIEVNNLTKSTFLRDGRFHFVFYAYTLFSLHETHELLHFSFYIHIVSPVLDEQFDLDSDFQIVDHKMFEVPMELLKDQILKFESSDIFFLEIIEMPDQKEIKTDTRIAVEVKQVYVTSYVTILCD